MKPASAGRRQFRRASAARSIIASPVVTWHTNVTPHGHSICDAITGQSSLGRVANELAMWAVQTNELLDVVHDVRGAGLSPGARVGHNPFSGSSDNVLSIHTLAVSSAAASASAG